MKICERRGCRRVITPAPTGRRRRFCSDACRVAAHRRGKSRPRLAVHHSSATDNWATPLDVYEDLAERFGPFDLDPCASDENHKAPRYYTRADDGLAQPWSGRVFMNPPYGREIGRWMRKAWEATKDDAEVVVCLVPARTDTRWWHDYATRGEVRFLRGRLRFGDATSSAPFPSAVVVFRNAQAVTKEAA